MLREGGEVEGEVEVEVEVEEAQEAAAVEAAAAVGLDPTMEDLHQAHLEETNMEERRKVE